MNQGTAAQQYQSKSEKMPTLNDRLNRSFEGIQFQCERIESVLARALGNPMREGSKLTGAVSPAPPTMPLSVIVEKSETTLSRLVEIANLAETIA